MTRRCTLKNLGAVAIVSVLAAAGCGRPRQRGAAPVGTEPSATVSPTSSPAGAPLAITYRWTVPSSAVPLSGRHRVFVHFLDREGALLFTDDHVPSPPPDVWQPGASYSCRRIVLTPAFPYSGPVTVAMGLYAEDTGARVHLGGQDLGQQRVRVAQFELEARDRDLPVRCEGLYEPEAALAAPLAVWRFLGREASCTFPNPHEDVVLFLRTDLEPEGFTAPPRLSITSTMRRDGASWYEAELPLVHEATVIRVRVAARLLGKGDEAGFRLSMSTTYVPARLGGADARELSLRLFGIYAARARNLAPELVEGVQ